MECPSCRAKVPEEKRFCTECGAALPISCLRCGCLNSPASKFCGDCGAKLGSASALVRLDLQREPTPPQSTASAERRQLTVMFTDLVGSTALASRLDPEDMRDVIGAYHRCVAETIRRFDGFVAKYMGDGVLVYFGYPAAHEEDAERAVRAGLALVDAVGDLLAPEEPLRVRIGVATGLVVVGDLIGAGAAQERAVVGETPNLAARLQALAAPNAVVIDQGTHRLTGGLFEYEDLGAVEVKGLATPVRAWRVFSESAVQNRFEALHPSGGQTPLVGREEEIELLLRQWQRAKTGEGQVVLLSGEAGIGKSRITAALQQRLAGEPHTCLRYFCSPHHQNSALHPTIAQLERAAGFAREDAPEVKLSKLRTLLAPTHPSNEDVALLAELLSIPATTTGRCPAKDLTPQRKKELTFEALVRQFALLARQRPVLIVFEDAHWVDPTSREQLDRVVDWARQSSALVLLTFRPEFSPPWTGQDHVTTLTLNRLDQRESAALVQRIAGNNSALPAEAVDEIVARTDGVPLFLEELTKAVVEADGGAKLVLSGTPAAAHAVPATLHASLMARLDRLGPGAKQLAQTGAAIGREFSYELLSAIAGGTERELQHELARLVTSELVFQRGMPPESTYTFKHALVQDAAYSTLLRSDRQQLHARIAEAVERCSPERVAREPEILAFHFMEARQIERAIGYWLKAGERAAQRSANLEAIRHLSRGLEALQTLPDSPARDRRELAYQIAIGTPLIAAHGYSAPQTGAAYSRARVLCERLGEAEPLVATLSGEFVYYFVRGDYPMMQRLSDEARQVSERLSDPVVRLASHRLAGITAMHFGAFSKARSEFEAILRVYDARQHRSQPVHYVHDPKVSALTYLALVLWILGFPEQARHAGAAAFRCAAELDQANLTAHVHNFAGAGLDELLGDVPGVQAHAEAIVELADRHSLGYWRVNGLILRGWAMVRQGAAEAGIALMCQNAAERTALGVSWYQARYLCMLAAAYAQAGQAERGLRVVAEAKDLVARNEEHMWEGELARIEGELMRVQGASAPVIEACYARAMAITRAQGAKSLELRAALNFARLWCDQGRRSDARALLTPTFSWFTEGFETADLRAAKALLELT